LVPRPALAGTPRPGHGPGAHRGLHPGGLGLLARFRQAQGDTAGALDAIGQAERVKLSTQVVALHNLCVPRMSSMALTSRVALAAVRP